MQDKMFFSGNEAIARGAYEAGVKVASAYPGTPSTEILQNLSRYEDVYTEWAPNEKVALEVALGASFAGARALAAMKHVGLNVAADPLFASAYTGVRGGLVIVTTDDPEMHSSQNEQDNRNYAFAAKIPMLEPSDSAEAKEFTKLGFKLSEEFDTPVLLRTTTRISHGEGLLFLEERELSPVQAGIVKIPKKFVMLPAYARARRIELADRMRRLADFAENFSGNRIEWGDKGRGFITSAISYQYVKEAFPNASVLKLGMAYPFPEKMIKAFAREVKELFIVEELDPFIELHVKAMGVECRGKELLPSYGEFHTGLLRNALSGTGVKDIFDAVAIPSRPPGLCPGCSHRGIFYALSRLNVFVAGDIGCYTLAAQEPLKAIDSTVCMGAGLGGALGMEKALGEQGLGKIVAVIGDSTFIHSGITGLIDIVYNKGFSTVIILDNRTVAMTGHQPTPETGITLKGERSTALDLKALCKAIGVKRVYKINPHDVVEATRVLKRELSHPEPSVIIADAPCVMLPEAKKKEPVFYIVFQESCTGCGACLKLGCPAIEWMPTELMAGENIPGRKKKKKGFARINIDICAGCGQCTSVCKFKAIVVEKNHGKGR